MILRVRRNFFKITKFPNTKHTLHMHGCKIIGSGKQRHAKCKYVVQLEIYEPGVAR